jgi:hypothetical protein
LEVAADVRFGSKADICSAIRHVRFTPNSDRKCGHATIGDVCFTPKSGLMQCNSQCLLWAKSGHCTAHSITSSVRSRKVSGIVKLIASAGLPARKQDS